MTITIDGISYTVKTTYNTIPTEFPIVHGYHLDSNNGIAYLKKE